MSIYLPTLPTYVYVAVVIIYNLLAQYLKHPMWFIYEHCKLKSLGKPSSLLPGILRIHTMYKVHV